MFLKNFIYLSIISISLILSSCNTSSNSLPISPESKEILSYGYSQKDVTVSSPANAHIITSDNYSSFFGDSSPESTTPESYANKYFIYNDTIWSSTIDGFVADAIPTKGECYITSELEKILSSSSFSKNQLVGILVREWSSYHDDMLSKNDIISIFSDFGFEVEYSTDSTIKLREQEYVNSFTRSENYFTVIGNIQQINSFIERCLYTDEAYVLHLAPCLYGFYNEAFPDLEKDTNLNEGEILIDNLLFNLLLNNTEDTLFTVAVKCWTIDAGTPDAINELVEYLESFGSYALYYKDGYRGTSNQKEYINGSDFDLVIRGTYNTICNLIYDSLDSDYAFSFHLANLIY